MELDEILNAVLSQMQPGSKFYLRQIDQHDKPTGDVIPCTVVQKLENPERFPVVLAHVGNTQEVAALHLTADEIEGSKVVTMIWTAPSDIEMDYGYPAAMLSGEWEGALYMVLD